MWHALQIELMKWRRTALLWVTVAAALATPFLVWLMFANREAPYTSADVMGQAMLMFAIMTGPLTATLIGAQSIASEFQYDTWKLSFTAPIRRGQVYLAKVLLGLIWTEGLSMLVFLASWAAVLVLPLNGGLLEPQVWLYRFLLVGIGLAVMIPFYHLVTLIFRSFFVTSGVGIVGTFTALIVLNSKYVGLFPISGVAFLARYWLNTEDWPASILGSEPVWLSILAVTFLLPLLASLLHVKRADLT